MTNDQVSIFDSRTLPGEAIVRGLISRISGTDVLKWMLIVGLVMYALFALVIIKQVAIMTDTLEEDANGTIKLFAWIHLVMALFLIVATMMWL